MPKLHYIDALLNEVNFRALFKSNQFDPNSHYSINLNLSLKDIESLKYTFDQSKIANFINDIDKEWRKMEIQFPNKMNFNAQIKVHGTSDKPHYRSNVLKDESILNGGYGLKIKLNKKEDYFNQVRRFNLLSSFDDWSSISNSLNEYIAGKGLITTFGKPFLVYINGIEAGIYMVVEDINKELLERKYKITNWAEFKTNDDWDKSMGRGHLSLSHFTAFDKEQTGTTIEAIENGQRKLSFLIDAVLNKQTNKVKSYINLRDFEWISAFNFILGTTHPYAGDNARFIYDFSSGRFTLAYRIEGNPDPNNPVPGKIEDSIYEKFGRDKILEILEKDEKFIDNRNKKLQIIINDWPKLFNKIKNEIELHNQIFSSSSKVWLQLKDKNEKGLNKLEHNIKTIKNYLSYAKLYVSKVSENKNQFIEVFLDSFVDHELTGYTDCTNKKIKFKTGYLIKRSNLKDNIHKANKITLKLPLFECDVKLVFKNILINQPVSNRHIYIKREKRYNEIPKQGIGLQQISSIVSKNNINVKKGIYQITDNLVFPKESTVTVDAGTVFQLLPSSNIIFSGNVFLKGLPNQQIIFKSFKEEPFGSIIFIGSKNEQKTLEAKHVIVSNGSETIQDGVYYSGQFSTKFYDVIIEDSTFKDAKKDDGLNIKNGFVKITKSVFKNNFGDQIDLDFAEGVVTSNKFVGASDLDLTSYNNDGLDVSGSNLNIKNNLFINNNDKGISVGEESNVTISNNTLTSNRIGLAIKDGSEVCISANNFNNNVKDISTYVKKLFGLPKVYIAENQNLKLLNLEVGNESKFYRKGCNE